MIRSAPLVVVAVLMAWTEGAAALDPGDVLVADVTLKAVLLVDPVTGDRTILSSSSVGTGTNFSTPRSVAVEPNGDLLVLDSGSPPTLFRVDPDTGDRTVLSSTGVGTGTNFSFPRNVARESSGDLLVTDTGIDAVLRVDPTTGDRTVVSSSSVGTGTTLEFPRDLALEFNGDIVVTESLSLDAVLRVDPSSGDRTIASDGTMGTGPAFINPVGIALESGFYLLVADSGGLLDALLRVDPQSGNRVVVSAGSASSEGAVGSGRSFGSPLDVFVEPGADILVLDAIPATIFRIDPVSGDRAVVSGCLDAACATIVGTGTNFANPVSIGVVAQPTTTVLPSLSVWGLCVLAAALAGTVIGKPRTGSSREALHSWPSEAPWAAEMRVEWCGPAGRALRTALFAQPRSQDAPRLRR